MSLPLAAQMAREDWYEANEERLEKEYTDKLPPCTFAQFIELCYEEEHK